MLVRLLIVIKLCDTRNTFKVLVALWHEMKIFLNCRLNPKILGAEGGDVEVHFQDLPLGVLLRHADCQRRFGYLTAKCVSPLVGHIFDQLLRNGATAAAPSTGCRPNDALRIYAGIVPEGGIFRCNHGILHHLWNIFVSNRYASSSADAIIIDVFEQDAITVINMRCLRDLLIGDILHFWQLALVIAIAIGAARRG